MTEEKMAYEIFMRYSLMKNGDESEYGLNNHTAKQGALIAVNLLQGQTRLNTNSYYSEQYWGKVYDIIEKFEL